MRFKNVFYRSLKRVFTRFTRRTKNVNHFNINNFKQISIESCNICNLNCPYCPTGMRLKLKDTPKGMMKLESLKDISEKSFQEYCGNIGLYNWGEPFLNPELPEIVKYLKETTKTTLIINSNFSFTDDTRLKEVLKHLNRDVIIISCDGFSQGICEMYRKNVDFDNVMHNIQLIIKNRPPYTTVMWQYLEFPWSLDEIQAARNFCDKHNIIFYSATGGITPDYPMFPTPVTKNPDKMKCEFFYDTIVINFDGEVFPCCSYYGPNKYSLGNAINNSLEEIFTKYKGKDMVNYLSNKTEGNDELFCKHCIERNSKELDLWKIEADT
ncbi:MAG: radical SAM protein [ANME-2 cluster archaeon]|nr:radical SAM protein [ANME-2 cluster archaeon]